MQGKKQYQEKLFTNFQLSSHVPEDNFYRRLNKAVDFSFIYKATAKYYGAEGQKSVDPVVAMKLMLVGYFENISSDRRIVAVGRLRLDVLFFLGYDIDEDLPWHSTLSRTRQLYGQEVFTALFKKVLKQCVDKGMVSGKRQAVDGVFVKASASFDSLVEKEVLEDAGAYAGELAASAAKEAAQLPTIPKAAPAPPVPIEPAAPAAPPATAAPAPPAALRAVPAKGDGGEQGGDKKREKPHNSTHRSSSDPDARMSTKRGKAMALNYLGQVCADTASQVITHIQAFTADKGDSKCLPEVLNRLVENLKENELAVEEVLADKGYSGGDALRALERKGITGYIPSRPQFVHERPGFSYCPEGDHYSCPNGKKLTYRGTYEDPNGSDKCYRAAKKDCDGCPLKSQCAVYGKRGAVITESIDKPYYDRMHERMQGAKAERMIKKRQSTVEPVIGTLANFLGMKRVGTKGLAQANKCLTMAGCAYNIKKLLKHSAKTITSRQQPIKGQIKGALGEVLAAFWAVIGRIRAVFWPCRSGLG